MISAFPLFIFLFGTIIGSFLNVVILRFIAEKPMTTRSACPQCHKTLRWWELVPLVSFMFLRGRCQRCRASISLQYPLVELALGIVFLVIFLPLPTTPLELFAGLVLAAIVGLLCVLFVIDLYTLLLPDRYIIGLGFTVLLYLFATGAPLVSPVTLLSLLAGPGPLLFLWLVTKGQGIGLGDVKLLLPVSVLLGVFGTLFMLWLAFIAGGGVALWLLARRRATMKTAIAFGPFLIGATVFVLLFPNAPSFFLYLVTGIH